MTTASDNRRRYERVGFFSALMVTPLPDGEALPARSFDISIKGLGMTGDFCLERGQLVRIGFHLENAVQSPVVEEVVGRIAYAQADENGTRLGVEFLEALRESTNPELTRRLQKI